MKSLYIMTIVVFIFGFTVAYFEGARSVLDTDEKRRLGQRTIYLNHERLKAELKLNEIEKKLAVINLEDFLTCMNEEKDKPGYSILNFNRNKVPTKI